MKKFLVGLSLVLVASVAQAATVVVQWTHDGVNTSGYKVERKDGTGAFTQIGQPTASDRSYTDLNVIAGDHTYRVRAFNADGDGPYSNEALAHVGIPAPNAPTNIIITITP